MSYNNSYSGGGYGRNPYQQNPYEEEGTQAYNNYQGNGGDLEMAPLRGNSPQPPTDPDAILNECKRVDGGIRDIGTLLEKLQSAQRRALNDVSGMDSGKPSNTEVDALNADIMTQYKSMLNRMKWIKSRPESGQDRNRFQVGRVERALKDTHSRYRQIENDYERNMRDQIARQYRITKPDATEEEVRQVTEDLNQQIFSQALMQSDRRGESRQVLGAVRERHEQIQKIERQMMELAELFQEMETMVVQQDPVIQAIEQKGEETHEHIVQANVQLGHANDSARAARRKKWWCLLICVAIVVVLIVILLIVLAVTHNL